MCSETIETFNLRLEPVEMVLKLINPIPEPARSIPEPARSLLDR